MGRYLKDEYRKKLSAFVVINILIYFTLVSGVIRGIKIWQLEPSGLVWRLAIPAVAVVLTLLLSGILPSETKARLVFWRLENPLPGSRAFTEIAPADARINMERLNEQLGELPTDPESQNRLWYNLLKQNEDSSMVTASHRDFLFARDVAAVGAIYLVVLPPTLIVTSVGGYIGSVYVGFLLVQYIVSAIAARNYGRRFVANVLAEVGSN